MFCAVSGRLWGPGAGGGGPPWGSLRAALINLPQTFKKQPEHQNKAQT